MLLYLARALHVSGERTRLACWRARPRDRELLFGIQGVSRGDAEWKRVSASRRCNGREATARLSNQHASRVRSTEVRFPRSFSFQPNAIRFVVGFLQAHLDLFVRPGRQIFSDVIGTNRQFAMAAIDQYTELNPRGTAE